MVGSRVAGGCTRVCRGGSSRGFRSRRVVRDPRRRRTRDESHSSVGATRGDSRPSLRSRVGVRGGRDARTDGDVVPQPRRAARRLKRRTRVSRRRANAATSRRTPRGSFFVGSPRGDDARRSGDGRNTRSRAGRSPKVAGGKVAVGKAAVAKKVAVAKKAADAEAAANAPSTTTRGGAPRQNRRFATPSLVSPTSRPRC